MAIKIDPLYGTESTWLDVPGYGNLATLTDRYSKPYFNHTIGAGLADGTLTTINASICPIAVDSGSLLANGHYVMLQTDGALYNYTIEPSVQTPLMYVSSFRGYGDNTFYSQFVETRDDANNGPWDTQTRTSTYVPDFPAAATSMTQPIADFVYKNYVQIIIVYASKTNEAPYYELPTIVCDLRTYLDHYVNDYPFVNGILVSPMRWHSESSFPSFSPSNISVSSDNDAINSTNDQKYFNFAAMGVGNVNKMTDSKGKTHTYHTCNGHIYGATVGYWNGSLRTYQFNGLQTIFGWGGSWADDMYQNYTRALYIPDIGNMNTIAQRETSRPDRIYTYYQVTDAKAFEEFCLTQVAYFGMFFSTSIKDMLQSTIDNYWDNDTTYMGIIDDAGVTHGEYVQGKAIKDHPQSGWDSLRNQSPYDYQAKPQAPDKEQKSDPYTFTKGNPAGLKGAFYYLCDDDILPNLQLWAHDIVDPPGPFVKPGTTDIPEGSYSPEALAYDIERRFNGSYPFDNILSVQWFPFDLSKELAQGPDFPTLNVIVLGNTTTSAIDNWYGGSVPAVNARQAVGSQYVVFDTEAYTIVEYFNDFRDYAPYTSMDLVIPWHGTISIDPGHWYGHQLSTKMVIDVITGASTTYIMRDSITIQSIDGHVGTSVPLSIRNIGDFTASTIAASQALNDQKYTNARSYLNSAAGIVGGAAMIGGAVATGNIPLAIAGGISTGKQIIGSEIDMIQADKQLQNKEFAVAHAPSGSTQVSAATPAVSQYASRDLRLIIKRPHLLPGYNATTYGASVGFACNRQGPVGNNTGFSVFSGADLDGLTATDAEKSKIYGLLQTGIII